MLDIIVQEGLPSFTVPKSEFNVVTLIAIFGFLKHYTIFEVEHRQNMYTHIN